MLLISPFLIFLKVQYSFLGNYCKSYKIYYNGLCNFIVDYEYLNTSCDIDMSNTVICLVLIILIRSVLQHWHQNVFATNGSIGHFYLYKVADLY